MKCPKCSYEQDNSLAECLHCGVIFAKIREYPQVLSDLTVETTEGRTTTFRNMLLPKLADPNPLIIAGRTLIFVLLTLWSVKFLFASIESNAVGRSFMHLAILPFHEAGHIIFSPFGRFIQVLGGTLGQLIMPAVCLAVLLIRTRDAFGAAVAQWWLAVSFMDIAPYINDARSLELILLGGVTGKDVADYHDWEYILRSLGILRMDHALACLVQGIGVLFMVTALLWAAANVWFQFKSLKTCKE